MGARSLPVVVTARGARLTRSGRHREPQRQHRPGGQHQSERSDRGGSDHERLVVARRRTRRHADAPARAGPRARPHRPPGRRSARTPRRVRASPAGRGTSPRGGASAHRPGRAPPPRAGSTWRPPESPRARRWGSAIRAPGTSSRRPRESRHRCRHTWAPPARDRDHHGQGQGHRGRRVPAGPGGPRQLGERMERKRVRLGQSDFEPLRDRVGAEHDHPDRHRDPRAAAHERDQHRDCREEHVRLRVAEAGDRRVNRSSPGRDRSPKPRRIERSARSTRMMWAVAYHVSARSTTPDAAPNRAILARRGMPSG